MIWTILAIIGAIAILRGIVLAADDGNPFAQFLAIIGVFIGIPLAIWAALS